MKHFRRLILLVCLTAAMAYLYAAGLLGSWPAWLGVETAVSVRVAPVRKAVEPLTLRLSGILEPLKEIEVASPLAGRVAEIRFKAGDRVRAGTIVAMIRPTAMLERVADQEAAVAAIERELQVREQQFDDVEKQLAKYLELHGRDLIAGRELAEAQSKAETARAQVEFTRARLTQQQALLAQARALGKSTGVTAPFDGVVLRKLAEPGAAVAELEPIFVLADIVSLKLTAGVEGALSADIHAGLPAKISSPQVPGEKLPAKVVRVDRLTAELEQAQIEIHASANQGKIHPGMEVEAQIYLERRQEVLWVPRSAVISTEGKTYVYLFSGGKALRREITIGAGTGEDVEIKSGLADGDIVIVDQLNLLRPGSPVWVSEKPVPGTTQG